MVFMVKGVDRFTRGRALPHVTPLTAPGFCGVSRKRKSCVYARHGRFSAVHRSRQVQLAGSNGGSFPAACLMYPTITERDLRSRGQTFHSVTVALTALLSVSDTYLRDRWVLLTAAGTKFHSGPRGLLRCVSFPRTVGGQM